MNDSADVNFNKWMLGVSALIAACGLSRMVFGIVLFWAWLVIVYAVIKPLKDRLLYGEWHWPWEDW